VKTNQNVTESQLPETYKFNVASKSQPEYANTNGLKIA
jgi:hypothetical protein